MRFVTKHEEFVVSDAPFSVPLKLGRYGLSEIINHLLSLESPQPFDFIINGILLRQSLYKYILNNRISTENVLVIEYVPALSISDDSKNTELPSWIGSLDSQNDQIIAGCYDGLVQFMNEDTLEKTNSFQAHNMSIKSIKSIKFGSTNYLATASKDQSIKIWNTNNLSNVNQIGNLLGHNNSVECLDLWSQRNILLSGDWNGNLIGWNLENLFQSQNSNNNNPTNQTDKSSKKKQKLNSGSSSVSNIVTEISSAFTIKAHGQSITDIKITNDNEFIFTSSWDHSLKKWDIERQDCVLTCVGSKVMTSLDISTYNTNNILTSHPDGKVRLWDTRTQDEAQVKGSYSMKNDIPQWISQVILNFYSKTIIVH